MNGKDLLIALGDISHKYYEEAENEMISNISAHRRIRRPMLIAAILGLMALLVGCAVVYALRLQDMSIGKETYTQSFADDGRAIEPTEKTRDIITLYGHSGDSIQQALSEWYDFLETYDPNRELADNIPDHSEIPNQYEYTYGCYTRDMADKVDAIAAKYDLKLLEEWLPFQQWQSDIFFAETGIDSFLLPDSGAEITHISGMYYPPCNFDMDFDLTFDKLEGKLWVTACYARKDYFPRDNPGGIDLSLYEQWDYTAPDGTALLLALSSKGHGYIIAQPEEAMLIYSIDGNFSGSAYPAADEIMTKDELEAVADLFDYSIKPEILDRAAVERQLEKAEAEHNAAQVYIPETFGSFADYLKADIRIYDNDLQYTFYDLTGDGKEDLLIGKDGAFDKCLYVPDGEVLVEFYGNTYVCEDGILENYSAYEIFEEHQYITPNFITDPGDMDTVWNTVMHLQRTREQWTCTEAGDLLSGREITPEEAQSIIDQYPRVELDWSPLMGYPLDDAGFTLGDYLQEKDIRVSDEALLEIYKDKLGSMKDMHYSHYRILDINGDGVDDLLLKGENDPFIGNTDFYWIALTYRYGQVMGFASDFYLCEDGVLEQVETRYAGGFGVEKNGHRFMRCIGFDEEPYELVVYNKASAGWQTDWWDEEPISEEDANAILAKYPRIDQGMRPIAELLG